METSHVGPRVADVKGSPAFHEPIGYRAVESVPRTPITMLELPDEAGATDG